MDRGRIIHGDGAIYQKVRFDASFCIEDYEVVEGAVSEVNDFGAFVRIGPMEALLHKSQIMEDHVDINAGMGILRTPSGRKLGVEVRSEQESYLFHRTRWTHVVQRSV